MKTIICFFNILLALWLFPSDAQGLLCRNLYSIQKRFLKHHVTYNKLTPKLQKKTLQEFISFLDYEKVYFLKSDIAYIKKRNQRLFRNLKRNRCKGLYEIYNIYSQRVKERMAFAENYLMNGKFSFNRDFKYIMDKDLRLFPASRRAANRKMEIWLQYQVANVFMVEKDLKKAIEQVSYIMNNIKKQAVSWKPLLSGREKKNCREKSAGGFKVCKPSKWFFYYMNAYGKALDSHSSYLDFEALEEFYINMNLELEGIGATLSSNFGYTVVERLIAGGPAERSKQIKEKDKILAVGQSPENLKDIFGERIEDVVSIIRGPKGTPVFLKILRAGEAKNSKKIFTVRLIRDKVNVKEEEAVISYHDIKSNNKTYTVGLLRAPSFYGSGIFGKSVSRDVKRLLLEAEKRKISALVLDLSNNRGGSLNEAVELSGLFFSSGNVVGQSERDKNRPQILKDSDKRTFYNGPLVVLVNRFSASASEIVSGALQDYKRAVIVGGDHTFGKGSVQSVEPLSFNLGALKTTVGFYFIPSGRSTQKEGVRSDISLPSLLNIKEFGEKSLDYALPPKTVKEFRSSTEELFSGEDHWRPIDSQVIEGLKKLSSKRVSANEGFKKIKEDFKKFQKKAEEKRASIGDILDGKDKNKKDNKSEVGEIPLGEWSLKKYLARPDVQEAMKVAADLAFMQRVTASSSAKVK